MAAEFPAQTQHKIPGLADLVDIVDDHSIFGCDGYAFSPYGRGRSLISFSAFINLEK